uniref:Isopenicillin N synthase n=1 Tax=Candidatus Kentrum sp. LFY TaxID=2126342 RepID=A0A450U7Z6_9GAMM|nr:MAG: Isopenicillin N synthase [Candidatus Kentron sp. LFY]VFJ89839.1 MAG: Isopenicillin N synthase [Candidatus Kentron sp. LFY]
MNNYPIINRRSPPKKVIEFFREFGFVLVEDSLFGEEKIISYFQEMKMFFDRFRREKAGYYLVENSVYGVYIPSGYEHVSRELLDTKEIFDVFHRESYTYEYYEAYNHKFGFRGRSPGPLDDPFLSGVLSQVRKNIFSVFEGLLKIFSAELGGFDFGLVKKTNYLFRLIHYPPIIDSNRKITRLGAHVDDDLLALVIAENMDGLKIKTPSYGWLRIPDLKGFFVVLIGAGLEFISEGAFKGTEHRVDGEEGSSHSRHVFNINIGSDLDFTRKSETGKVLDISKYYRRRFSKYSLNTQHL